MPSEKILEQKKQYVAELTEKVSKACAGVLVDYKGITVEEDTKLRKELREANIEYMVAKNTYLRFAFGSNNLEELNSVLEGTTAIALSENDSISAARILAKRADDSKTGFAIKGGFLDGKVVDKSVINEIAKLPSKEVLIAKMLGGFNAPISSFARVLNAICEKQNESESA